MLTDRFAIGGYDRSHKDRRRWHLAATSPVFIRTLTVTQTVAEPRPMTAANLVTKESYYKKSSCKADSDYDRKTIKKSYNLFNYCVTFVLIKNIENYKEILNFK